MLKICAHQYAMSSGIVQNGAVLDYGEGKNTQFDIKCPDGGRVILHGELVKE